MARISTPCVNFCWSDPVHGLCEGCGRTRAEIASWCFISEDERLAIMQGLPERLARTLTEPETRAAPAAAAPEPD